MTDAKSQALEVIKSIVETISLPTGITVSGLTFMGITLADWVFMGTAVLLLCNLGLAVPKAYRGIRSLFKKESNG